MKLYIKKNCAKSLLMDPFFVRPEYLFYAHYAHKELFLYAILIARFVLIYIYIILTITLIQMVHIIYYQLYYSDNLSGTDSAD